MRRMTTSNAFTGLFWIQFPADGAPKRLGKEAQQQLGHADGLLVPFALGVNPLRVLRRAREGVDAVLPHLDPAARPELATRERTQRVGAANGGGHATPPHLITLAAQV